MSSLHISIRSGGEAHHHRAKLSKTRSDVHQRDQGSFTTLRDQGLLLARCRHVEACIALVFAIPHHAIRGHTRGKACVARARQVAMYLCHTSLALSLTEVGHLFDRDRTTAGHACRLVEGLRDNPDFDWLLGCLEKAVRAGSEKSIEQLAASALMAVPQAGVRHHG